MHAWILRLIGTLLPVVGIALSPVMGQSAEQNIEAAMASGDAKALSVYFTDNIDLLVLETDDVYSRQQAEIIVQRFFTDHPPVGYENKHRGKSRTADSYQIGKLTTKSGNFRITVFVRREGDQTQIRQLRIEQATADF